MMEVTIPRINKGTPKGAPAGIAEFVAGLVISRIKLAIRGIKDIESVVVCMTKKEVKMDFAEGMRAFVYAAPGMAKAQVGVTKPVPEKITHKANTARMRTGVVELIIDLKSFSAANQTGQVLRVRVNTATSSHLFEIPMQIYRNAAAAAANMNLNAIHKTATLQLVCAPRNCAGAAEDGAAAGDDED
jgi:hypothetical protein